MFNLTIKAAQAGFFDRAAIDTAADKATKATLAKFGAFVRRTAQQSIKTGKAISRPGRPPSGHTNKLKKLIYFAFDARKPSVVIGPALLRAGSTVPHVIEFGGASQAAGRSGVRHYRPRPFMGPAFDKELKKAPDLWANSIK